MAAASSASYAKTNLRCRVAEIAQCPICLADCDNPKSLPCLHSFCLQCLQNIWMNSNVGDTVPCPLCRKEFEIPEKGLDLPHNFLLQDLIDAKEESSDQPGVVLCEVCAAVSDSGDSPPATMQCLDCKQKLCTRCSGPHSAMTGGPHQVKDLAIGLVVDEVLCEVCVENIKDSAKNVPAAIIYCVDCNQKLCNVCSKPHRMIRGGPHQMKDLGAELPVGLVQQRGSYCDKHTDRRLELYCFTCNVNVCMKCCIIAHPQPNHRCKEIEKVATDFGNKIDSDVQAILSRVDEFNTDIKQTEDEDHRLRSAIHETVISVKERGEYLKGIIDSQVDKVVSDLDDVLGTNQKAVAAHKNNLDVGVKTMTSFCEYSQELRSNGSPCDITRAAYDLHARVEELLRTYVSCGDYCAPGFNFVPANIDEFISGEQSFIGHLLTSNSAASTDVKKLSGSDKVAGLAMLHQELFVLHQRKDKQVSVYSAAQTSTDYTLLHQFTVNQLSVDRNNDMTASGRRNCLYMSDCGNKGVHKVAIHGDVQAKWQLPYQPWGLSLTPSDNLLVTCHDERKLLEISSDSGECLREIALQSDIKYPLHALQLSNLDFLISHGYCGLWSSGLHRICRVDQDGEVSLSYGQQPGSDATQLNYPRHVVTDRNNSTFVVADLRNYRLAVLSGGLQLIRHIRLVDYPRRLCLDHVTRRLFVGELGGDVTVIQL